MSIENLTKAIVVTAEVMGHEISTAAARDMALELNSYPHEQIAAALGRCKREVSGRLTLAAVIQRVPDGHVGAEEAWALCPRSEADSTVWTDEISAAFGVARELLAAGDAIEARMAFKEAYAAALREAKEARGQARWWVSLGHDASGRVAAVRAAVEAGRLPASELAGLALPSGRQKALPRPTQASLVLADDIKSLIAGLKRPQGDV